jgi:hypothetical protein
MKKTLVSWALIGLSGVALSNFGMANRTPVRDDGSQVVFSRGSGDGRNHTFRNRGPDDSITVYVYGPCGCLHTAFVLGNGAQAEVFIPIGGAVIVSDDDDHDNKGASIDYDA